MTAFWTKHDFDAANDPKMMRLLVAHKYEGYGYFWRIIEMLGASSDHTLKLDDCESIAYAMHTECERINVFILDCIDYGLFTETNGVFWSNRLCDELMEIDKKSTQGRDAANIRWEKYRQENADAMPTHSERNASRVEQSRVEKNKKEKDMCVSFELFYQKYPRKVGRATALKAFKKIPVSDYDLVMTGLESQLSYWRQEKTQAQYIKHPSSWLNGEHWNDTHNGVKLEPVMITCLSCEGTPTQNINGQILACADCKGTGRVQS